MSEPSFAAVQAKFTAHMRDPKHVAGPDDVEDRRLKIYRDLLYNNVEGFMSNAFPVLRKITDDAAWQSMIRHYFTHHQARTPLFPKMAQEFLHYLESENAISGYPDFITELAHYEWLEAEVTLDTREISEVSVDSGVSPLKGVPVPNPVMRPYVYRYPVHRIGPDYQPSAPPEHPTYLVVLRHLSDEAGFIELNAVSARLLELILSNETDSGEMVLRQIAMELGHTEPDTIVSAGAEILDTFITKEILLGACQS